MKKQALHACRVSRKTLAKFLRDHADDLPPAAIKKAVADLKQWVTLCDRKRKLGAVMRAEQNDWYLCTLKNAAVRPDLRGQGHGTRLYRDTAKRAKDTGSCLVLAADVTITNKPSIKALKRAGLKPVSRFCWGKGQKPADVLHFVKTPPTGGKCR